MFKSNNALKQEVIRYFRENGKSYLTTISNEMKNVLKEYKKDEKIETIDKLIASYELDINGLKSAFKNLDDLCANESSVFLNASDYEASRAVESLKRHNIEFEAQIKDLIGKNPTNKNEIILVQAQKIMLFDHIFKIEPIDNNLEEFCYFKDSELEKVDDKEQVYVFGPIIELYDYLMFE